MESRISSDDVALAASRDEAAFCRLYMATADRIHSLARWLLGTSDVDDVVQEVYLRAWSRLPELREPAAFTGWLRQVAVRVILRERERSVRRGGRDAGSAPAHDVADTAAAQVGLRLDLERAIAQLPAEARRVFVLYDVGGFRHRDIAALIGISPHTSRSQLHRARALLKTFLRQQQE